MSTLRTCRLGPHVVEGKECSHKGCGQQACVTGKWTGSGEGTSKHSGVRPTGASEGCHHRAGWKGPGGSGKGGFDPAHYNMSPADGKAGPGKEPAPPAVQQADGENLP